MDNNPSSSTTPLKRGVKVTLTAMGYKGVQGSLDAPARTDHDGTACWYVVPLGKHTGIRFRVDEFKVNDITLGS